MAFIFVCLLTVKSTLEIASREDIRYVVYEFVEIMLAGAQDCLQGTLKSRNRATRHYEIHSRAKGLSIITN